MLIGRQFRLKASILGIYVVDGQRTAVMIPEGATVKIVSGPRGEDRIIDLLWGSRVLAAFAVDVVNRGEEIESTSG